MMRSIATAVAGLMFIMGVALVNNSKMENSNHLPTSQVRPSIDMLITD